MSVDVDQGTPDRARVAKLLGMLGSPHEGERLNALAALDRTLDACDLSWGWLSDLVARGEVPGGPHEALFKRLLIRQLREGLDRAWAMGSGEARFVRNIVVACESGRACDAGEITKALSFVDAARRSAGRRG